ncbi:hypothetical protein GP486_001330 [Trichoglossum hirsutum]|uniref:Uncharacterized protein n=1 Tax=Trichoglossum hirsutum TaxID=265104 RepID=A0A9P8LH41_9PEZI|nr:hypothetical protein GP486_001330 [Trichoglossum hirsutum]
MSSHNEASSTIDVDPEALPDTQYLTQYKTEMARSKNSAAIAKNIILGEEGLEVKAFLGLQRLIVARYEQKLHHFNDKVFQGQSILEGKELEEVQAALHRYCESMEDLEKMLQRQQRKMGGGSKKDKKDRKKEQESLQNEGIEIRRLSPGHPSVYSSRYNAVVTISLTALLKTFIIYLGITVILTPMILIVSIPDISKGAVLVIVAVALAILSSLLGVYAAFVETLSVLGVQLSIFKNESMSGKDILMIVAAYSAVLIVFIGAYIGPHR